MCRLLKTFSCIVNRDTCMALEGPLSKVWDQIDGGRSVVPDFENAIQTTHNLKWFKYSKNLTKSNSHTKAI